MPRTSIDGTAINYEDNGRDGVPLLFLHAFPFNARMWASQFESLGERHRCIAPDLKGFGDSDAPDDLSVYSIESYAHDAKALLDHLGVEKVVLIGLSMGGYVAFEFLRHYPQNLAALVLADTRAEADAPEVKERRNKQQEQVRAEGISGLIDTLTETLLSDTTRENKPDVVAKVKTLMENPASGYLGALEAMKKRRDSSGELSSIAVPTLVTVGEKDALSPPEVARKMHEQVSGSKLVVVPEAGHLSSLEDPDAFNGALADFLESIETS